MIRSAAPNDSTGDGEVAARYRPIPEAVMRALRCPLCRGELSQRAASLCCPGGHSFDRARQGYVTLRPGDRTPPNADTPSMVMAREVLLGTGLYEPIRARAAEAVAEWIGGDQVPLVADLAGGTGYYLAGILDRLPDGLGLSVDLSAAALKRAARSHPRTTAIGANLSDPLPMVDASMSAVMSIFGPRPVPEMRRVLRDDGVVIIVTPTPRHLAELIEPLGMVHVDRHKDERLLAALGSFVLCREEVIEYRETVTREEVLALAGMGPSAHHTMPEELAARADLLPGDTPITVSVTLRVFDLDQA